MKERLQKIIAHAGIASRRAAEALILQGRVTVNGEIVTRLGVVADPALDEIRVDGALVTKEETIVYIMLNKPAGYVTTMHDPQGRPTVKDLLAGVKQRVYPIGRLDYDSEGLLLCTNDGDLAQRLLHPRYLIPKTYRVKIRGSFPQKDLLSMAKGVMLDDGLFRPGKIEVEKVNKKSTWLVLTIQEGRNRVIRRAFEKLGYFVARLIRVRFGALELEGLLPGEYRYLKKRELNMLGSAKNTLTLPLI
ncbi:MAG: pseudouridine synthase [Smithellaceae bacterium]|nr:pseudouridine synthase [Smithellaceae bacterium]